MTDHDDLAQYFAENDGRPGDASDGASDIGARLAHAREAVDLTRSDIAARIGVKESTVAKWERGNTSPRGHHVSKLAGMLGVSMSWILMGRGIEPTTTASEIDQLRHDLDAVRARLDDVVNELAVLDQHLAALDAD